MAEESEKRLHAIMDKLFHAPPKSKSKSSATIYTSLTEVQLSRGKKRPNMTSSLAVLEPKSRGGVVEELHNSSVSGRTIQVPLCRPWDREDLLRRLATFKSMSWFAKPKVVNAVNCARRGWVNVDSDIITCEACGARLLFSTPSSWTQHQVEKAALVFSLKLDNGHKQLCPWVENACNEMLIQFPPTPSAVLVDNYKKQCSALLQLLALPMVSSSAIDYLRSPQLEHFLKGSSTVECVNKPADASTTENLGNECEAVSSVLYYQAQKLISLCGWVPRSLPYIVDCKDREDVSVKDADLSDPSNVVSIVRNPSIRAYSSGTEENMEANDDPMVSGVQYDLSSVVLDCKLCGASVGLWAFSTAPRPLEFIRLVGYSEVNGENTGAHHAENVIHSDTGAFRAHDSGNENHVDIGEHAMNTSTTGTTLFNEIPFNLNLTIAGGPPPAKQNFRPTISLPVIGRNLRARLPYLGSDVNEQGETLRNDSNCYMSLEGASSSEQGIPETSPPDSIMENPLQNTQRVVYSSSKLDKLPENVSNVGTLDLAVGDLCNSQVGNSSISTPGGHDSSGNDKTSVSDKSIVVAADNCYLEQNPGVVARVQPVNTTDTPSFLGKDLKQLPLVQAMEFDPIRQHRHFCPWITSNGNSAPGWLQTLSALQRQKEFSYPSSTDASSYSLIKVDDPVASVKKLFTSSSAKRMKLAHGST